MPIIDVGDDKRRTVLIDFSGRLPGEIKIKTLS